MSTDTKASRSRYSDFVAGSSAVGVARQGVVVMYLGGVGAVLREVTQMSSLTRQSMPLAGVGDFNGDGFGDFVWGAPDAMAMRGMAWLYLGNAAGMVSPNPAILQPSPPPRMQPTQAFGTVVASAEDANGDGFGDVLVSATPSDQVFLVLGRALMAPTLNADTAFDLDRVGQFGASMTAADFNRDGVSDLLLGAPGQSRVFGFPGIRVWPPIVPVTTLTSNAIQGTPGTPFGTYLAHLQTPRRRWLVRR